MSVMILAAGRGERLRPITDSTPKALVEVNGVSLLERHLQRLADAKIKSVVINLGWLGWSAWRTGCDHGPVSRIVTVLLWCLGDTGGDLPWSLLGRIRT